MPRQGEREDLKEGCAPALVGEQGTGTAGQQPPGLVVVMAQKGKYSYCCASTFPFSFLPFSVVSSLLSPPLEKGLSVGRAVKALSFLLTLRLFAERFSLS